MHQARYISPLFKKILLVFSVLLLISAGVVWYIFNEKFTDTHDRDAEFMTDASSFISEFQKNTEEANKKYAEKIIVVNGVVSETEKADTTVNIKFTDSISGGYIIFAFQQQDMPKAKELREGDKVSIKGSCSGGAYSSILETVFITFKRCAIINN